MKNTEIENVGIEEVEEVMDIVPEENSSNGIIGKIAVGIGIAALAGIGVFVYKNKEKLRERRIAKLEKEGYMVTKLEEPTDEEIENFE